jgi:thiamine kinase-like enzyme
VLIDPDDIACYILDLGIVDLADLIEGRLKLTSIYRRNCNTRVEIVDECGYMLKQPSLEDAKAQTTLLAEATFYQFCQSKEELSELCASLPHMEHHDPLRSIVLLNWIDNSKTLWEAYHSSDKQFPFQVVRDLGCILGTGHRLLRGVNSGPGDLVFSRACPWSLRLHQPTPAILQTLSPANHHLLKMLQIQPAANELLEGIFAQWEPETIIHGDIRGENILVSDIASDATTSRRLSILDWEMVQYGDPAWDIAGFFQDTVCFWVSTLSWSDSTENHEPRFTSPIQWSVLQRALRAFWLGYKSTNELINEASLLRRAVMFSAPRLLQSIFEIGQDVDVMAAHSFILLQIAMNILKDPDAAQIHCYGVPIY